MISVVFFPTVVGLDSRSTPDRYHCWSYWLKDTPTASCYSRTPYLYLSRVYLHHRSPTNLLSRNAWMMIFTTCGILDSHFTGQISYRIIASCLLIVANVISAKATHPPGPGLWSATPNPRKERLKLPLSILCVTSAVGLYTNIIRYSISSCG